MSAEDEMTASAAEADRADAERARIIAALVARFRPDPHPTFSPEDPADYSALVVYRGPDLYPAVRPLTFGEIADALVEE